MVFTQLLVSSVFIRSADASGRGKGVLGSSGSSNAPRSQGQGVTVRAPNGQSSSLTATQANVCEDAFGSYWPQGTIIQDPYLCRDATCQWNGRWSYDQTCRLRNKSACWDNCDAPVIPAQCDNWCAHLYGDDSNDSNDNNQSQDDFDSNDSDDRLGASNGKLGMPAPSMGGLGEPCYNSNRFWGACNWWEGLSCHKSYNDHSSIQGTCEYGSMQTGGDGQQCNFWGSPCNDDCESRYISGHNGGWSGRGEGCFCQRRLLGDSTNKLGAGLSALRDATTVPAKAPSTFPANFPATVPEYNLGMPAPQMGGYGQPCRTQGVACNNGLVCYQYTTDGTSSSGFCSYSSNPNWVAHQGEKCGAYADGGKPNQCANGLYCEHQKLLGTANAGWTATCQKPQQRKAQEGEVCGAYAPLNKPYECAAGLQCTRQKLLGTANAGWTATCQKPQQRKAQEGEVCGAYAPYNKPHECAAGLTCKTQKLLGTANAGYTSTCVRTQDNKAQYGQRCGGSALPGKPTQCEDYLQCKTDRLGVQWISTCQ